MVKVEQKTGFYKDRLNKKVSGVCAGIANHYEVDSWLVRLAALVTLFMFPLMTLLGYGIAHWLMPSRY